MLVVYETGSHRERGMRGIGLTTRNMGKEFTTTQMGPGMKVRIGWYEIILSSALNCYTLVLSHGP